MTEQRLPAPPPDSHLPPKPPERFNDWGKRRFLTADPALIEFVDSQVASLRLEQRAKSLCRAAMLTRSQGLEFVLFSSAQLNSPLTFLGSIQIVPCFEPIDLLAGKPGDQRAMAMSHAGIYIYDGWVPNDQWTSEALKQAVSHLDTITNLFTLFGGWFALWEPKYPASVRPTEFHQPTGSHLSSLDHTLTFISTLAPLDQAALIKSAAWLSNALQQKAPAQRFLLLFLSIESIATYIENDAPPESPLRQFSEDQLTKHDKEERRAQCIQQTLDRYLAQDATEAIRRAYFDCVSSTRGFLQAHLTRAFNDPGPAQILFEEKVKGKTLWQIRNDIAHGSLDIINEPQLAFIERSIPSLEKISRGYLRALLSAISGADAFPPIPRPGLIFPLAQGVGGPGTQSSEPTDMAEYYGSGRTLLASFVEVTFR